MTDWWDLAALPDPLPVEPLVGRVHADQPIPGSKSITNRALICAALAGGTSVLRGALVADDTDAMVGVLRALGLEVTVDLGAGAESATITVTGCGGEVPATDQEVDVRQSGTTARFALPLLALGRGSYRVTAHPQMQARPMGSTIDALRSLGAGAEELGDAGHLPLTLTGGGVRSGVVRLPGDVSSQFLSGLLLVAPCLPDGLVIEVTTELVSRPYVDLTIAVMAAFGARVDQPDPSTFAVAAGGYAACTYDIEPDASAASYLFAAAAICGGTTVAHGLGRHALQGDVAFVDVLEAMGAAVERHDDRTEVRAERGSLGGGTFDLTHFSDTAQTLAVVAAFAAEPVAVTGIGFIRNKEIDRVAAVATELDRCGIRVRTDADGWTIWPGPTTPAVVQTYEDHRMAMSFALLGLAGPGIAIAGPACVAKTFPGYWARLERLRADATP